jgi:diaminopropionate ammonia-lyase
MYLQNTLSDYGQALDPRDAGTLGRTGADAVTRILALREGNAPTPLVALPNLARDLGLASVHVKDEGQRLGLGSFKALGGAYALMRLVQAEAEQRLGHPVPAQDLLSPEIRAIAATMTFACATDGNHGRSVAQGAQLMGARAVIFVHAGVSQGRIDAIAHFGAQIMRVAGSYDASVTEASRVAGEQGWTVLSDTSWPGYEYIPGLVMQGYTAIVREALAELPADTSVPAGRRRRFRRCRRRAYGGAVGRRSPPCHRRRPGPRRLPLCQRQSRAPGQGRGNRADGHGHAGMP